MSFLVGRTILIVQRQWIVAHKLAAGFEAAGARVLLANDARTGRAAAHHADLAAAVLDGQSQQLWPILKSNGIPFLIYTGGSPFNDVYAGVPIVKKPARTEEVLETVRGLLQGSDLRPTYH